MDYWSEEKKDYIKSLTKKKVLFAGIPNCNKINLKINRDNYDLILARSKTENFYIALNTMDYLNSQSVCVPKQLLDLMKKVKIGKALQNSLSHILCFESKCKEKTSNIVYLPSNDELVERFFSEPDSYFNRKD